MDIASSTSRGSPTPPIAESGRPPPVSAGLLADGLDDLSGMDAGFDRRRAGHAEEVLLLGIAAAEQGADRRSLIPELVAHAAEHFCIDAAQIAGDDQNAALFVSAL